MHYEVIDGRIRVRAGGRAIARTVAEGFVQSVEAFGPRPAIKPVGAPAVSYAELGRQVQQAVGFLRARGLQQGGRIAILLPNSLEWAVFSFAAALLGACVVPVNLRFRPDEVRYVLEGSSATILVTRAAFLSNPFVQRLREVAGGALGEGSRASVAALPALHSIVLVDDTREPGTERYADASPAPVAWEELRALAAQVRGDLPMWLFWTSGTTSAPKGALLPQSCADVVWRWTWLSRFDADDRVLTTRPFFYIAGYFWALLGPLLHGAQCVVCDLLSPEQMQSLCRSERVTVLSGNYLVMKGLIDSPDFDPGAFAHVRKGHVGGIGAPLEEMRRIKRRLNYEVLIQTYGMTELSGFLTSTLPDDSIEAMHQSCGFPFTDDVELRLVDPETGRDVPDGQPGMLVTRGQKLITYTNLAPEVLATFYDAGGWFRTGDLLARLPDGRYRFVGRAKDLIKVGGENVTAGEIESALMRHPDVVMAAVVGVPDAGRGEVPVAYLEYRPGATCMGGDIGAWCKANMAPYKTPARFHAMAPGSWPLSTSGKIAKHLLRPPAESCETKGDST